VLRCLRLYRRADIAIQPRQIFKLHRHARIGFE
jgi:hypothetical protein